MTSGLIRPRLTSTSQAKGQTLKLSLKRHARALRCDLVLAFKEITRRKRRSAVAVVAVAFGVVALVLSSGFIEWIFHALRDGTIRGGLGHVQITRPGFQQSGQADPLSFLLPALPKDLQSQLASEGVESIAPRLSFSGLVSFGESTLSFQGEGIDPVAEEPLARSVKILQGEGLTGETGSPGVLLGEGLAANLGVRAGDQVVLLVNTPNGGVNALEAKVRGVFGTATKAYDDATIRLPIANGRALLRVEGATTWTVALVDTDRTDATVERLRALLPAGEYEVTPWHVLADFYRKTVVLFSKQLAVLNLIVVVIVVLTISNSLTISAIERTSEIGTSLALGVPPSTVLRRFIVEGIVLGLIGAGIGLACALAAAQVISAVGIPMPPPPGMARGYRGAILVTAPLVETALVLAMGSALLGAILPAYRASRMNIVDAIRQGK